MDASGRKRKFASTKQASNKNRSGGRRYRKRFRPNSKQIRTLWARDLTVWQLRDDLRRRKLSASGTKLVLANRLQHVWNQERLEFDRENDSLLSSSSSSPPATASKFSALCNRTDILGGIGSYLCLSDIALLAVCDKQMNLLCSLRVIGVPSLMLQKTKRLEFKSRSLDPDVHSLLFFGQLLRRLPALESLVLCDKTPCPNNLLFPQQQHHLDGCGFYNRHFNYYPFNSCLRNVSHSLKHLEISVTVDLAFKHLLRHLQPCRKNLESLVVLCRHDRKVSQPIPGDYSGENDDDNQDNEANESKNEEDETNLQEKWSRLVFVALISTDQSIYTTDKQKIKHAKLVSNFVASCPNLESFSTHGSWNAVSFHHTTLALTSLPKLNRLIIANGVVASQLRFLENLRSVEYLYVPSMHSLPWDSPSLLSSPLPPHLVELDTGYYRMRALTFTCPVSLTRLVLEFYGDSGACRFQDLANLIHLEHVVIDWTGQYTNTDLETIQWHCDAFAGDVLTNNIWPKLRHLVINRLPRSLATDHGTSVSRNCANVANLQLARPGLQVQLNI